jgi:undecaprenyl diphosphate synthase
MTEDKYIDQIDKSRIPQHVAIIMDGNGRWAKQRNRQRSEGHIAGAETVKSIIETAAKIGVKYLTLYTFSKENWNRPEEEVTALMHLLFDSLEEQLLIRNGLCFRVIGDIGKLPVPLQEKINKCISDTKDGKTMTLVLALSYSSHWEITEATRQLVSLAQKGKIDADDVNVDMLSSHLATSFMPNPDLLIRTGGELRLSNFLLWQCAYSELYFCDTYWPDFSNEEFYKAIVNYQNRERRYGKTSEQIDNSKIK